jgi:hypothetical protein
MITTFQSIDIGPAEEERKIVRDEIVSLDDSYWFYDSFRNCKMLPFYNGGGKMGKLSNHKFKFDFTEAGKLCPVGMDICKKYIFSWTDPYPRITILRTNVNSCLNPHIDCTIDEIGTNQYKLRFVLDGQVEKLYFLDSELKKNYIPKQFKNYIIDGGHVHGLDSGEEKITLCGGAPWGRNEIPLNNFKLMISRPKMRLEWSKNENIREY